MQELTDSSLCLSSTKKRDLVKYAKTLTVRFQDLAEFIDVCQVADIGYRHQM